MGAPLILYQGDVKSIVCTVAAGGLTGGTIAVVCTRQNGSAAIFEVTGITPDSDTEFTIPMAKSYTLTVPADRRYEMQGLWVSGATENIITFDWDYIEIRKRLAFS